MAPFIDNRPVQHCDPCTAPADADWPLSRVIYHRQAEQWNEGPISVGTPVAVQSVCHVKHNRRRKSKRDQFSPKIATCRSNVTPHDTTRSQVEKRMCSGSANGAIGTVVGHRISTLINRDPKMIWANNMRSNSAVSLSTRPSRKKECVNMSWSQMDSLAEWNLAVESGKLAI